MKEPSFSFNDFKNWMNKQDFRKVGKMKDKLVGAYVESKISAKKLVDHIESDNNIESLAKDFKKNGGTVIEVYRDDMVLIEVDSGQFSLHKYFIKNNSEY